MPSFQYDNMARAHVSRRTALKIGAAAVALAGCSRLPASNRIIDTAQPGNARASITPTAVPEPSDVRLASPLAWLASNRLMFGPRNGDLAHIDAIGFDAFVEEQLARDQSADEGEDIKKRLAGLDVLALDAVDLFDKYDKMRGTIVQQLGTMVTLRAIYSQRQLYEVMVDFWTNHFNIFALKDRTAFLKPVDDRKVIRPHALGNFRDLLSASAHSPAMLFYLDNQANRKGHPDENYARELLELHTLGVNGGYTETDVHELARALSGWGVTGLGGANMQEVAGEFRFNANQHDDGQKTILGMTLPAKGGAQDVEKIIEMLATHPSTATYVATKLARRFISDEPPASAIAVTAAAFTKSKGDIKATLGALLHGEEFKGSFGHKIKRPLEVIASVARALDANVTWSDQLANTFRQMGQPLFLWSPPNGFPDVKSAWIESSSLLARWNFAIDVCSGAMKGFDVDLKGLSSTAGSGGLTGLSRQLINATFPKTIVERLQPLATTAQVPMLAGLMLASPMYQVRG